MPNILIKTWILRSGQMSDLVVLCLKINLPSEFDEADLKLIDGAWDWIQESKL